MPPLLSSRPLAFVCLALSMILVGSYVALSKPLAAVFPVLLLAWLRFGIGGIAMLGWLHRPANEVAITPTTWRLLFLQSLLGHFLFTLCMVSGVSMTGALTAGIIMAALPAMIALLSRIFLKEMIRPRIWLAMACATVAIALLALAGTTPAHEQESASTLWLGKALLLLALLCEAAFSVIGKNLIGKLHPKRIAALINLWGFVLASPFGIYLAGQFDFASVSLSIWLLLLFYALAASIWSVWLWMTGLSVIPASQAGVFTVLLPVSAVLVGVLVLGESLNGLQMVALVIALFGVVLATLPLRWRRNQ